MVSVVRALKLTQHNLQEEIMKKIYITFFVLAAMSGAAYANGDSQLRDSDTYFGKYSTQLKNKANKEITKDHYSGFTVVSPLAIGEMKTGLTNFERMMKISKEPHQGNRR
jgi:hypothetical protein